MLEETRQANPIIRQMLLLADDDGIVFSLLCIELHELLTISTG